MAILFHGRVNRFLNESGHLPVLEVFGLRLQLPYQGCCLVWSTLSRRKHAWSWPPASAARSVPPSSPRKEAKQFFFFKSEKPVRASFFGGSAFSLIFHMDVSQAGRKWLTYEFRCRSQRWRGACVCALVSMSAHMCVFWEFLLTQTQLLHCPRPSAVRMFEGRLVARLPLISAGTRSPAAGRLWPWRWRRGW